VLWCGCICSRGISKHVHGVVVVGGGIGWSGRGCVGGGVVVGVVVVADGGTKGAAGGLVVGGSAFIAGLCGDHRGRLGSNLIGGSGRAGGRQHGGRRGCCGWGGRGGRGAPTAAPSTPSTPTHSLLRGRAGALRWHARSEALYYTRKGGDASQ